MRVPAEVAGGAGEKWKNSSVVWHMDWVVEVVQAATEGSGTEALTHLIRKVAEKAQVWNALVVLPQRRHPMVLAQAPIELEVCLPEPLLSEVRSDRTQPGGKGGTIYWHEQDGWAWGMVPLSIAELYYVLRVPVERRLEPLWELVGSVALLLGRHERFYRELSSLRLQSERRLTAVANLYESALASGTEGLEQFLKIATRRATQAMDADACTLMLLDPETETLRIVASYGLPETMIAEAQVPLGEGIAGIVALTGEPMLITDPELSPQLRGVERRPEISGSICVPLRDRENKVFGVLTIRRLVPSPPFGQEDLRLFTIFVTQVALALENVRLYERLHRNIQRLTTLSDLTQVVTSVLDIDKLFEIVARQIAEQVGFSRCALFLQKDSSRVYVPRFLHGYHAGMFSPRGFRRGQGVIGIVAQKRIPLVVQDARHEVQPLRGFGRAIGANRYCVLPIVVHGNCIGVLLVDNADQGGMFTPEQVELLVAFVNQVGIALENARLYQEAKQRLIENQQLAAFRDNILRSLGSGMFTVDTEGRITTWNRTAERILGYSAREMMHQHYTKLLEQLAEAIPSEKRNALMEAIQAVVAGQGARSVYKVELRNPPQGVRMLNFTVTPLVAQSRSSSPIESGLSRGKQTLHQGAVVLFEDITEYVNLEARLSQVERLATVGQMTATIAHEIRNPLTALKGAVDLLRYEPVPDGMRVYIEVIEQEVVRLAEIAEEFLEFAKPFQIQREQVMLKPLVERALRAFAPLLKQNAFKVQIQVPEALMVFADPSRLEQALRNLLQNAFQAMPEGGTVRVVASESSHEVWIQIQDTGSGVPEEIRDRIFNPFFTTRTRGTGLGLSIVQKIMEGHGGRVQVENHSEGGSIFTLCLPKI